MQQQPQQSTENFQASTTSTTKVEANNFIWFSKIFEIQCQEKIFFCVQNSLLEKSKSLKVYSVTSHEFLYAGISIKLKCLILRLNSILDSGSKDRIGKKQIPFRFFNLLFPLFLLSRYCTPIYRSRLYSNIERII